MTAGTAGGADRFAASWARFEEIAGWLGEAEAGGLEHAELEDRLQAGGSAWAPSASG